MAGHLGLHIERGKRQLADILALKASGDQPGLPTWPSKDLLLDNLVLRCQCAVLGFGLSVHHNARIRFNVSKVTGMRTLSAITACSACSASALTIWPDGARPD